MKFTWEKDNVRLYCGDCLDAIEELDKERCAILTDPPYGCNNNADYTRFSGGRFKPKRGRNFGKPIYGDDHPFDPSPWMDFPKVVLWGYHYFAQRLPVGTVLVWNKKRENQLGTFLSDCELGWQKGGHGVYLFNHLWSGFDRQSERGKKTLHPNQKPIALWDWVLSRLKIPKNWIIVDGYMGSGSCGIAAIRNGYSYVGCEIDPNHFATAQQRIETEKNKVIQQELAL